MSTVVVGVLNMTLRVQECPLMSCKRNLRGTRVTGGNLYLQVCYGEDNLLFKDIYNIFNLLTCTGIVCIFIDLNIHE